MPSPSRRWTNDDRQIREREQPSTFEEWVWSGIQYGLAQVCLLTAPMLWLIFQTPRVTASLKATTFVFVGVGVLVVSAFRQGWLSVGRPWPLMTATQYTFGEGYAALVRRSVLLSHLLGVATFGSVLVATATGLPVLLFPVAAVLTVVGISVLPWLVRDGRPDLPGRVALYALSTALVLVVGDPLTPPSRFRTAPAAFAILVAGALVDCRGVGRLLRRRVRRRVE